MVNSESIQTSVYSIIPNIVSENEGVDCGGYRKSTCYYCILNPYLGKYFFYLWCNGDCAWDYYKFVCRTGKFQNAWIKLNIQIEVTSCILLFLYFVASCTDGQQNQDEIGIDCGGSCPNECGKSILSE